MKIALIPAYEPDDNLLLLVNELIDNNFEAIVVVDDGSGAEYKKYFDVLPKMVHVISYEQNGGKGHALKTGLSYIKENYCKGTVVTLDSDGQHKVSDALNVLQEAMDNPGLLAIGSRKQSKKTPFKSRLGNWLARTTFLISTGHKIYDTQTGLRAFDVSMIDFMLKSKGERYEYEMNVLLDTVRHKNPIKEIWIETIYKDNNSGSHYNPFKDSMRIFKEVIKFSLSSIVGFLVDYTLFALLTLIPVGVDYWFILCNILARVVSATVNFTINYKLVFKAKDKLWVAALKYAALAAFILGCNTGILYLLVQMAGLNELLAKIIVECVMFIVSWLVQRLFVFRKRTK